MKHVVMFSGGLGSWQTAKRVAAKHGTDNLVLLFADVAGSETRTCPECEGTGVESDADEGLDCPECHGIGRISRSPHVGEDEDTYRFIRDAAANVGGKFVRVADAQGRDIWGIFRDDRFLGNSRLANCSKYGKQKPCRDWLDANCDPAETTLYVGLDWSEPQRIPGNRLAYAHPFDRPCVDVKACLSYINGVPGAEPCKRYMETPWRVEFPMNEAPYIDKAQMMALCEAEGIEVPRLYKAGFAHNNCGGGCVRAGQAQFELLLREHPERYRFWEEREQELRDHLEKDVSILKDRTDGKADPMTLRAFREGIEGQGLLFDPFDVGGCGCFVDNPVEDGAA